jgi:hypothetical protein
MCSPKVCKDSMKVQIKAQDLTEEMEVASQRVTSNEDTAKFEEPVRDPRAWPGYSLTVEENAFYNRNPRPLLAADIANRRVNAATATAGPGPSTPQPCKKQKPTAPSPYNLSAGIRASAGGGRVPWARPKAATPVRVGREMDQEAAAGNGYILKPVVPRELAEADELPIVKRRYEWLTVLTSVTDRPPAPTFKTPFLSTTTLTPTQRSKRKLDQSCECCSCSG